MFERLKGQPLTAWLPNPFSSKPTPFDPKGILSVRWCSISDPSKSPSALECGRPCTEQGTPLFIPPNPWGSGRDAFAHSSPAYAKERLRHSRWFPGAYAMLPSGTPSRPNTAIVTKYSYGWVWATAPLRAVAQKTIGCFSDKKPEELFASRDFEHGLGTMPMS